MTIGKYLKECLKWLLYGIVALPIIVMCLIVYEPPIEFTDFWNKNTYPQVPMLLRWFHNFLMIVFLFVPSLIIVLILSAKFDFYI